MTMLTLHLRSYWLRCKRSQHVQFADTRFLLNHFWLLGASPGGVFVENLVILSIYINKKLCVLVVNNYADTDFRTFRSNIFVKTKNCSCSIVHMGSRSNISSKKWSKISWHCPFKLENFSIHLHRKSCLNIPINKVYENKSPHNS